MSISLFNPLQHQYPLLLHGQILESCLTLIYWISDALSPLASLVPESVMYTLKSYDVIPAAQQPLTARPGGFVLNLFGSLSVILTASPTEHLQITQYLLYLKSPHGYLATPAWQIF